LISVKKEPKPVSLLIEDIKSVAITGYGVYTNILEILVTFREDATGLKVEGSKFLLVLIIGVMSSGNAS